MKMSKPAWLRKINFDPQIERERTLPQRKTVKTNNQDCRTKILDEPLRTSTTWLGVRKKRKVNTMLALQPESESKGRRFIRLSRKTTSAGSS